MLLGMIAPGILHLRQPAIIQSYPPVKNTRHDFQEKNNDQLWMA